jgi:hypothetical protein
MRWLFVFIHFWVFKIREKNNPFYEKRNIFSSSLIIYAFLSMQE